MIDISQLHIEGWAWGGPSVHTGGDELTIQNGHHPDIYVSVSGDGTIGQVWTYTVHERGLKVIKHFSLAEVAMITAFVHMEGWL